MAARLRNWKQYSTYGELNQGHWRTIIITSYTTKKNKNKFNVYRIFRKLIITNLRVTEDYSNNKQLFNIVKMLFIKQCQVPKHHPMPLIDDNLHSSTHFKYLVLF